MQGLLKKCLPGGCDTAPAGAHDSHYLQLYKIKWKLMRLQRLMTRKNIWQGLIFFGSPFSIIDLSIHPPPINTPSSKQAPTAGFHISKICICSQENILFIKVDYCKVLLLIWFLCFNDKGSFYRRINHKIGSLISIFFLYWQEVSRSQRTITSMENRPLGTNRIRVVQVTHYHRPCG